MSNWMRASEQHMEWLDCISVYHRMVLLRFNPCPTDNSYTDAYLLETQARIKGGNRQGLKEEIETGFTIAHDHYNKIRSRMFF